MSSDEIETVGVPIQSWEQRSNSNAWLVDDHGGLVPMTRGEDLYSDLLVLAEDAQAARQWSREVRAEARRVVAASRRQRRRLASRLHLVDPLPPG